MIVQPTFLSKFRGHEQNWIKIITDNVQKKLILKRWSDACEFSIKMEVAVRKVFVLVTPL